MPLGASASTQLLLGRFTSAGHHTQACTCEASLSTLQGIFFNDWRHPDAQDYSKEIRDFCGRQGVEPPAGYLPPPPALLEAPTPIGSPALPSEAPLALPAPTGCAQLPHSDALAAQMDDLVAHRPPQPLLTSSRPAGSHGRPPRGPARPRGRASSTGTFPKEATAAMAGPSCSHRQPLQHPSRPGGSTHKSHLDPDGPQSSLCPAMIGHPGSAVQSLEHTPVLAAVHEPMGEENLAAHQPQGGLTVHGSTDMLAPHLEISTAGLPCHGSILLYLALTFQQHHRPRGNFHLLTCCKL